MIVLKQTLTAVFVFCSIAVSAQNLKELSPVRFGKTYNEQDANAFDAVKKDFEKNGENWTAEDWEKAVKNGFSEAFSSDYWDVIGDACSWYCGGKTEFVAASSFLPAQGNNSYTGNHVDDLNTKTVWAEGVPGYGIGEWIQIRVPEARITTIIIVNGYVKSQKAWENNSRVKQLKLYLDDKPYAILNLKDCRSEQYFELDEPFRGMLKFEIVDVYKGKLYDDTVISEIFYDGIDVH